MVVRKVDYKLGALGCILEHWWIIFHAINIVWPLTNEIQNMDFEYTNTRSGKFWIQAKYPWFSLGNNA